MLLSKLSNLSEPQFPQGNETVMGFPSGSVVENSPDNVGATGDTGSIPGSGRYPGGVHGNPLQYSYQENPMDRRAWWAMVHKVTKSWT